MSVLSSIIGAVLKALLDFFQQGRELDKQRAQAERLAREAEHARIELEKTRKSLDDKKVREAVDETVRNLDAASALERLRSSVRA